MDDQMTCIVKGFLIQDGSSLINQVKQMNSSYNPDLWEPFSSIFQRTP